VEAKLDSSARIDAPFAILTMPQLSLSTFEKWLVSIQSNQADGHFSIFAVI
jgi:hypothetical protein